MMDVLYIHRLGGGFMLFLFASLFGEMIQFDDCAYFSDGLVQPPTSRL